MKFSGKNLILSWLIYIFANPVFADSLWQIYQIAKKNDNSFKANLARHKASLEKIPQAKSYLFPDISANLSANSITSDASAAESDTTVQNIIITQPIFNKGTLHALSKIKLIVKQSNLSLLQEKQTLMLTVAKTYFDILKAKNTLKTLDTETISISRQLADIQQKFKVGLITKTALAQAQAKRDLIVAKKLLAETNLMINNEKLREIINKTNVKLQNLKPNLLLTSPKPDSVDFWVEKALKNNITLKIQQLKTESAAEEISLQRSKHYPTLTLSAIASKTTSDNKLFEKPASTKLSLQLNLPIFSGNRIASKTNEARQNFIAIKADFTQARRQIKSKTRALYFTVLANIKQIKAVEQSLKSAKIALKADEISFNAGVRTFSDVLNTQSLMFQATLDLITARYNYLSNLLSFKQVTGVLNEADLQEISYLFSD